MGFGVWGGLQSIGNGCGIQIDGFSARTEPYGSIFDDFYDFDQFGIVFAGLMLVPEGPRTLRECPEGPGTLWECPAPLGVSCPRRRHPDVNPPFKLIPVFSSSVKRWCLAEDSTVRHNFGSCAKLHI